MHPLTAVVSPKPAFSLVSCFSSLYLASIHSVALNAFRLLHPWFFDVLILYHKSRKKRKEKWQFSIFHFFFFPWGPDHMIAYIHRRQLFGTCARVWAKIPDRCNNHVLTATSSALARALLLPFLLFLAGCCLFCLK